MRQKSKCKGLPPSSDSSVWRVRPSALRKGQQVAGSFEIILFFLPLLHKGRIQHLVPKIQPPFITAWWNQASHGFWDSQQSGQYTYYRWNILQIQFTSRPRKFSNATIHPNSESWPSSALEFSSPTCDNTPILSPIRHVDR